jgi:hypothetical protein
LAPFVPGAQRFVERGGAHLALPVVAAEEDQPVDHHTDRDDRQRDEEVEHLELPSSATFKRICTMS